jgi:hypothetical protein
VATSPVLVPRRADAGPRDAVWKRIRELIWDTGGWQVVQGYDEGPHPFCRAAALNAAAELAGDWTVAVIADADSIVPTERVLAALELAEQAQRLVICHDRWVNVRPDEHDEFLRTRSLPWRDDREIFSMTVSSMLAVPRSVWDQVGGFDEQFIGYGYEDNAFTKACRVLTGEPLRMVGSVYHLSHEAQRPRLREQLTDPSTKANRARWQRYALAKTPAQINALRVTPP